MGVSPDTDCRPLQAEGMWTDSLDSPSTPSTSGRRVYNSVLGKMLGSGKRRTLGGSFFDRYKLGRLLGCGAFSTVRIAVDLVTGQEWACKIVTEKAERELLLEEVQILEQLDHPNLLKYHAHFDEPDHLYILTEVLGGSDLLSAVMDRGSYSEDDAREVMRQVLSAVAHLDSKGIAHRDLKMENVMLVREDDITRVKIIDFGLSGQLSETKQAFDEACGTPACLAPEVVRQLPYGTKCDVWAVGVLLFLLLSGDYPYQAESVKELVRRLRNPTLKFSDPVWEITSAGSKDLVATLLTANPAERPSAQTALLHPWLSLDC